MKKLSSRDRKFLIGGGITATVIVVAFYIIIPFVDSYASLDEELSRQGKLLQESVEVIRNKRVYQERSSGMDRELARLNRQLLDGSDEVTAQNQLETIVREIAEYSQITISRSFPIQGRTIEDRYSAITVEITVDGDLESLAAFLQSVGSHSKYLKVDEFNISSTISRRNQLRRLSPRMQISGFIKLSQG